MTAPLRIGILGAAGIAPRALVDPARQVDDVEVVAVAGRDAERSRAFAQANDIPVVHQNYDELLEDPAVDAVYIALPNSAHGLWTKRAVTAGKHVLCEKPFTANAVEAAEVAAVIRGTDRVVMEAFHYRYHPLMARVLEIVDSGEIGAVSAIESGFGGPGPASRDDIRWSNELAGGALMDVGCYPVHFLRSIARAEPIVISAVAGVAESGVDGDFELDLRFESGATGHVSTSMWAEKLYQTATITGRSGIVEIQNPFLPQWGATITVTTEAGVRVETPTPEASYYFQLLAFAEAVLRGGPVLTGPADSVATMVVIDDAYVAAGMTPRQPG